MERKPPRPELEPVSRQDVPGGKRFLCFGLVMLDILITGVGKLPEHWEETIFAGSVLRSTGGGAGNSAITLSRLGADVEIAGKIGDDDFGEIITAEMRKNGVSIAKLLQQQGLSSGIAVGLVNPDGKRCFITSRGANTYLDPGEFDLSLKDPYGQCPYGYFLINGFFQFPQAEGALLELAGELRRAGIKTGFDMASWDGSGRWMRAVAPFLPYTSYFFCNTAQLEALTGKKDQDAGVSVLKEGGAGTVIIKMGERGCTVYGDEQPVYVAAPDLPVVDTTGAGDSFDGAYLFADSQGWNPFECGAFSNMVAGINCGSFGATRGVPDTETTLREMVKYYPLPKGRV